MTRYGVSLSLNLLCIFWIALCPGLSGQEPSASFRPVIPRTWDDAAIQTLEVPLAHAQSSPVHVSASYYYRIPVRPIYKSYPVYEVAHEPKGYWTWLQKREPVILWDDSGHRPTLQTEADWIKAGELVFQAPVTYDTELFLPEVRDPKAHQVFGPPLTREGVNPFVHWVIREKGKVELGFADCGECHSRVMRNGTILRGAQGNLSIDLAIGFAMPGQLERASNKQQFLEFIREGERSQFETPWLKPGQEQLDYAHMSLQEIAASHNAIPVGVFARQRASVLYPPHIPNLVGVQNRKYLDASGLVQQRNIGDLMRYAALNQGGDLLSSFGGFIPVGAGFKTLPDPDKISPLTAIPDRYSDEQLYALALYIYSLRPPTNPNPFDALASQGQKIFQREGCSGCHPPPFYTNNMLTPALGFRSPETSKNYDVLPISVGTDPGLTMLTRRGTGYYKVPSLQGVWYRSMFGHSGWCATLEDWFDQRRLRNDYNPTGFKGYEVDRRAVKGHEFGLSLSAEEKKALIAFLRTI